MEILSILRHEYQTRAARATRVRHTWDTSDTSSTRMKNFDFDNDTSEDIFSHPYISYKANERLQGEEQFHSRNYRFGNASFPCQNVFEKCTTKTENGRIYIKNSCTRL